MADNYVLNPDKLRVKSLFSKINPVQGSRLRCTGCPRRVYREISYGVQGSNKI